VFTQKRQEAVTYCELFQGTIKLFSIVMEGEAVQEAEITLKAVLTREVRLCDCCVTLGHRASMYYQALAVTALYYLRHPLANDE
jgi:hypothetical protein